MAHSFKTNNGYRTFGQFNEPDDAGNYIYKKKAKTVFCNPNLCKPSITVNTQENLRLLKTSNFLKYYSCSNSFNKANLNINLITVLDLSGVPVIQQQEPPFACPTPINILSVPYINYTIDPSGNLFGNTTCGLNNYVRYMLYNPAYKTENPGNIGNL